VPPRHPGATIPDGPRDRGGSDEAGFDTEVTAGGVRELLTDAERVLPAIAEYALEEAAAGLRPGSPDNLPVIGELEPGVLAATGHHRHGILLAPLTADAIVALLRNERVPQEATPAAPGRFCVRSAS
jgi:glycine oxidase